MSDHEEPQGKTGRKPRLNSERLLRMVQGELVPRLLMAQKDDLTNATLANSGISRNPNSTRVKSEIAGYQQPTWQEKDFQRLGMLCVQADIEALQTIIDDSLSQSISLDQIYLGLLAPTARWLGDCWLEDTMSFVDVHLGLLQLHKLISFYEMVDFEPIPSPHSIMLACTPGDQHTFGLSLVADFFRRAGWKVNNQNGHSIDQLESHIASTHYSCIGLSLHSAANVPELKECIERLRKASANTGVAVVVGGNYFSENPRSGKFIDSDLVIVDAGVAVQEVLALLAQRKLMRSATQHLPVT